MKTKEEVKKSSASSPGSLLSPPSPLGRGLFSQRGGFAVGAALVVRLGTHKGCPYVSPDKRRPLMMFVFSIQKSWERT
jgi:hypothetical protein